MPQPAPGGGKILVAIAVADVVLAAGGTLTAHLFTLADMPLALAFSTATVLTFFGLIHYARFREPGDFGFREALAGALFTLYLLVVSNVIFFRVGASLPPLAETMVENFTTLTTVVAGFYFGGKAIEGAVRASGARRSTSGEPAADTSTRESERTPTQPEAGISP
jgi:hypothetical protein